MSTNGAPPIIRGHKTKKVIAVLILAFAVLFAVRFVTGFFLKYERSANAAPRQDSSIGDRFSEIRYEKAVSNNFDRLGFAQTVAIQNYNLLEVFAKEARLRSATAHFEDDEVKTRSIIEQQGGLIRIEQKSGLKPNRTLQLVIRVPESKFDGLVGELQKLGTAESFQVSKEDKSEEAKKLLVEKKSLEDYRNSLVALRKTEGKVEEFVALEGKVQEVQRKLEELDARIGGFTGKESFNNVSFDLGEKIIFFVDENKYPISARLVDALLWTIKYYFLALFVASALGLTAWSAKILFGKQE